MNKNLVILLTLLVSVFSVKAQEKTFNILDYGAKKSHTEVSTKAIQSAIDAAFENGGGTVIVPQGVFVTGTLFLKSNVTFKLKKNTDLFRK